MEYPNSKLAAVISFLLSLFFLCCFLGVTLGWGALFVSLSIVCFGISMLIVTAIKEA